MNSLKYFIFSIALSSALISVPFISHAQTAVGTTAVDGVDISYDPSNPTPGSSVSVSVDSYSIDLNKTTITWSVAGKSLARGIGLTSIDVIAPAVGSSLQVIADISTVAGGSIKKAITITSGDVDLIWETSGYTPPMYRGKVPFSYQNTIKFTAIPHFVDKSGKAINPATLIYKWANGSTVFSDQSGYGQQSVVIKGGIIPRELDIDVLVSSADPSIHGEAQAQINAVAPTITFYQDDPLYGVMYANTISDTLKLFHNEVKVLAAPYGFDINDPALTYDWEVNNVSQSNLTTSRSIVLRVPDGQQGNSNISVGLSNSGDNILQGATSAFNALFDTTGKTTNTATF